MDAPTYAPNGRILVVDDDARALQAMSELLEFEGFSVFTAQNGLDAPNKMRTADHISLVLLDLWMPVMNGWEVLRRKRSDADIGRDPRGCAFSGPTGFTRRCGRGLEETSRSATLFRNSQTTQQMRTAQDSLRIIGEGSW
jgi:hypothetical protein